MPSSRLLIGTGTFLLTEICFWYRSNFRLAGYLPNDYECRKYGVLESKERLERKKQLWTKYADYKREWCRRFDYHVYGIRPGENWGLFSACWLPSWEPMFCKKTDYPPRKNPYFLSSTPLRELFTEGVPYNYMEKVDSIPAVKAKPELKYMFHSPLEAGKAVREQR
ncbi:hypothetical protein STCU_03211 [Strigomonas culicis]|nr:hypothetical protein STCU_03211 [Strigomonas culicis]|eukprot:EPY31814.1 hypothetical protein STCU_03211 [Strigomonas culicis]